MFIKTTIGIIVVCIVLLSSNCKRISQAQITYSTKDFLVREMSDGTDVVRYRVFVPKNRKDGEKLPVMLYFHGSEERGEDNEGQLSGPAPSILNDPTKFHFIIVFPQCPAGRFWDEKIIERSMKELDQTVNEFNGDVSRLYLAGFSLGGYGVWHTAAMYPEKFAAVIPMSGRVLPRAAERKKVAADILKLADAEDPYQAFADKLSNTPIWIFHGENDNIVPFENSRRMAKSLTKAGNKDAHYTELKNTGHVSLNAVFDDAELFKWLAER